MNEKANKQREILDQLEGREWGLLRRILLPLASLKLTVVLLALGLFMVWVATLEQARHDIWYVKKEHFSSPFVYVPFQTFFPPAWFPKLQDVRYGLLLPSGSLIIFAMLANLLAAHLYRFRLQARGARLAAGMATIGLGSLITALIIANGQNAEGFQAEPVVSYQALWALIQVGIGAMTLISLIGLFRLARGQVLERILLSILTAGLGLLLTFLLLSGQRAFIGDSAMRVLWQLLQGAVCALVLLFGCQLLFRRKAGIVLLHSGLLLMMAGELYTTYTATERRMVIFEGETVEHAIDIRSVEMAVLEPAGADRENVVSIPASLLRRSETIDDPALPFLIRPIAYYPNTDLFTADRANLATHGIGRFAVARPIPVTTGAGEDQSVDLAAAYVQLLDKQNGDDLGTYLLSQVLYGQSQFELDTVEVGNRSYRIGLRFVHEYKPYSVHLYDARQVNYLGTEIARWYSSDFQLVDPQRGVDERKKVWMNNPLRYGNETFYQADLNADPARGQYTMLQIVKNTGWLIPYVSCMIVMCGLIAQFGGTLLGFMRKYDRRLVDVPPHRPEVSDLASAGSQQPQKSVSARRRLVVWIVPVVVTLVMALWIGSKLRPSGNQQLGLDLGRFGRLAVTYEGRIQPLDSLARNTVRQLRKMESVIDGNGDQQPAIAWLAATMFGKADDYFVFRVDDPQVEQALDLTRRKNHLYTFAELNERQDVLNSLYEQAAAIRKTDPSKLSNMQRGVIKLYNQLQTVFAIRLAMGDPWQDPSLTDFERVAWAHRVKTAQNLPLIVPAEAGGQWKPLSPELAHLALVQLAQRSGISSISELAKQISEPYFQSQVRPQLVREAVVERLIQNENLQRDFPGRSADELRQLMLKNLENPPPEIRQILEPLQQSVQPLVDLVAKGRRDQLTHLTEERLRQILEVEGDEIPTRPGGQPLQAFSKLESTYRAGEATPFNQTVSEVLAGQSKLPGQVQGKLRVERLYNEFSPFYFATVLYIAAFVFVPLSWIGGWNRTASRTAFWLIMFGFLIHSLGLLARIYISGRPPVTNLYSSAIFISWAGVLFGLILEALTRMGIGSLLAAVGGAVTLMVGHALSLDGDTFTVLQAVLDTQFWLSTHVVCISLGYVTTMLAGLLGTIYILGGILSPALNRDTRNVLATLMYGMTCFGLLFSFFGTVLGGLWADDSWGRFWGWDPKENGALMIVLANALLLHARWSGVVRQRGIAVLAVFGMGVTVWSWFAVNELGIGLHSYGISEGRMFYVFLVWCTLAAVMLAAAIPQKWWWSLARRE